MEKRDVVIIGGGPAGRVVVHALHAAGAGLSVTLIKDEEINVNRCAVPYGIADENPLEKYQIPNALVTDFGAELVIDRATAIDTAARRVTTSGGRNFEYGDLVLATGSRPLIPPLPGVDAPLVTPVRSLDDLSRLRRLAADGHRAVVVGGGYIGIEVAVVLREMGIEVTLVEMLPRILSATTEPEFIGHIEEKLTEHGIRLLTGNGVASFAQRSEREIDVRLNGDGTLTADFVVMSVGVILNTELAAAAGLKSSRLGIWTDRRLRTSAEHVYAAGDCVEKWSLVTGQPCRGEFGTNAVFMARVAARNILGGREEFPGVVNANATTVFDIGLGQAGLTEQMAREAGIAVVTGTSQVLDRYPMMPGAAPIHTKLVFDADTRRLVGGCVLRQGHGAAQSADFISFAVQKGTTLDDLLRLQYATHPEQAAKPSDNAFVFAARQAAAKMQRRRD